MVTEMTAFTVSLQWGPPVPANGIILNYIIRYYQPSSPDTVTTYSDSIVDTNVVIDSLNAFTTYVFRVSAVTVEEGPHAETEQVMTLESSQCKKELYEFDILYVCSRPFNKGHSTKRTTSLQ